MRISFDDISIRRKFLWIYIFCVCIPIGLSAIIWTAFTSRAMRLNTTHYLEQTFNGAAEDFNILTQTAINIANQIGADKTIFDDLSIECVSSSDFYDLYWNKLRARFNKYLVSNPDIAEVSLYIDNPDFMNLDYFRRLDLSARQSEWYRNAVSSDKQVIIFPGSSAVSIIPYPDRITVIRKMQQPDFLNNAENYLLIELRLDRVIERMCQEDPNTRVYLSYGDDEILWSSPYIKLPAQLTLPDSSKFYVLQKAIGTDLYFDNWQITGVFNSKHIYNNQLRTLGIILLITLGLSMLSVLLIHVPLNSLSRRISALSSHMRTIGEGRMEPIVLEKPGNDEAGFLIIAFNDMISEINDLINVVYKLEMQKKDAEMENIRAEYKYLQAQVDPHFLFNTLNAVLVYCVKNKYDELANIIGSLSKLTKRMLIRGTGMIPLSEEFDFIEKYLIIEKFRFGNLFSYSIQIDPASTGWLVPKLSIQPLVENACKHGLQGASGDRKLTVCSETDEQGLKITISDNGIGMEENVWREAIESASDLENSDQTHIGLQNVYRRMRMCYGNEFRFHIKSAPGQGAYVEMRIDIQDKTAQ